MRFRVTEAPKVGLAVAPTPEDSNKGGQVGGVLGRHLGGDREVLQAECTDRSTWVVLQDRSNPNLLGAREHHRRQAPRISRRISDSSQYTGTPYILLIASARRLH